MPQGDKFYYVRIVPNFIRCAEYPSVCKCGSKDPFARELLGYTAQVWVTYVPDVSEDPAHDIDDFVIAERDFISAIEADNWARWEQARLQHPDHNFGYTSKERKQEQKRKHA